MGRRPRGSTTEPHEPQGLGQQAILRLVGREHLSTAQQRSPPHILLGTWPEPGTHALGASTATSPGHERFCTSSVQKQSGLETA